MPISPAYEWSETALTVTVKATCKGATSTATDVYSSPHYVSANAPPFFLELDLHGAIDSTRSVANVSRGVVTLKLFKAAEGLWGRLLVDMQRAERLKRREASRELAAQEAQAATERKSRAKWDDSRFSLGHQMDKDRAARLRIDEYKSLEAEAEADALESWQAEREAEAAAYGLSNSKTPIASRAGRVLPSPANKLLPQRRTEKEQREARHKEAKAASAAKGGKPAAAAAKPAKPEVTDPCGIVDITDEVPPLSDTNAIFPEDGNAAEDDEGGENAVAPPPAVPPPAAALAASNNNKGKGSSLLQTLDPVAAAKAREAAAKAAAKAALPPPRSTTKIKTTFTKQLLSAPARTKNENADYDLPMDPLSVPEIFKNKDAGGDISQRDPAWLKDRGDRYFRMGDHRSAEEAYSLVLHQFASSIMGQAIDCVTACHSNRAACRLQAKQYLAAADDCGHALAIMSKARCVTEYPKTEEAQKRCRMRLLARRGGAYAKAGVLHRALTDLRRAGELADGPMPSDAADKQMLATDTQRVADRHDEVCTLLEQADALLATAQDGHRKLARAGIAADDEDDDDGTRAAASAALAEARAKYDRALLLAPLEVGALANRAACVLQLHEPSGCVHDCTAALTELDCEEHRAKEQASEFSGMFAPEPLAKPLTAQTDALAQRAPQLRFELLTRRAAARVEMGEAFYPNACTDLKAALKLQPAEPSVVKALDDLAQKAAAAGVELEPLPPTLPTQGLEYKGDDDDEADEEEADEAAADEAAADGATAAAPPPPADGAPAAAAAPAKPPVGTRSAAQLKADADGAFREARLGKAVTLYGKALKADASAEWLGEGKGLLFRCQCLANRSACHLKLSQFKETCDDAAAAIAALGTGMVGTDDGAKADADALLLKLLARRGMALCQLTRYDEAAADYARAVGLDPSNEQLASDLRTIEAMRAA